VSTHPKPIDRSDPAWQEVIGPEADPEAWRAFQTAMIGRRYGVRETIDAWMWFYAGWTADE
jgi:hypothetical protein